MQASGNYGIEFILLLLLLFSVGFGTLAQRLKKTYAIVLVIGGVLLSLIPGLLRVSLDPDLIFLGCCRRFCSPLHSTRHGEILDITSPVFFRSHSGWSLPPLWVWAHGTLVDSRI